MSITYVCRHCGQHVGTIEENHVTEEQLGFHKLTPEERSEIISYENDGSVVAQVTCEHCQEAIERQPECLLQSKIHH